MDTLQSRENLAWAAGLWEGEGCFHLRVQVRSKSKGVDFIRTATMGMTDRDVMERFAAIMGYGNLRRQKRKAPWKDVWVWHTSRFELVQMTVCLFWPWLCSRRRAAAKDMLEGAAIPGGFEQQRALDRQARKVKS